MSIPKGILATDKWFQITNYAGNEMDTTSSFSSSSSINSANMGKIVYSSRLNSLLGNQNTCTPETCVPYYNDPNYFSIIDISKHLAFRMDYFITELYALSNCIQKCVLTPPQPPTSCVVDSAADSKIQYCNKQLYGTTAASTESGINDFIPYIQEPRYNDKKIKLNSMPKYITSDSTTINIINSNQNYQIKPNPYFDLNRQYTYIQNLISTFDTLLTDYNNKNNTTLDINYNALLNKRVQMDTTLEEIFGKNNTMNMQSLHYYDSTIYTSIFWTVLVTSLLFYTFRKL